MSGINHDLLHDFKIMCLLVLRPSCDRKTTFLSFFLTILLVGQALKNGKASWKQQIIRPISDLVREQIKQSLCTHNVCTGCPAADFLHLGCLLWKCWVLEKGGGYVLRQHCTNPSHWVTFVLYFPILVLPQIPQTKFTPV